MSDAPEVEQLRQENRRLKHEVERLRAELQRVGGALGTPAAARPPIEWEYQRGDLEDDLGDD